MKRHTIKRHLLALSILLTLTTGCGASSQPDFDAAIPSGEPSLSSEASGDFGKDTALWQNTEDSGDAALPQNTDTAAASQAGGAPMDAPQTPESPDLQTAASSSEAPAKEPAQVSLLMVGDILLHAPVEKSAKRADGTYSYDAIFADTKDLISAADLALVNQEVILGGEELGISGYPAFNAPYAVGDDLVEAGFDVICHATNHAMDKGKKGVTNCLTYWEENHPGIQILGLHDSPDDPLYVYEQDGIRIAFLNYTYGTNGIALPSDMPYAVDLLSNKSKVIEDIKRAESVADFTVVCPHWGTEYRLTADASQEKWANIFLENGVDLVIGTHPHVIEPVTMITDDATGHSMLVYYSLGNFVNWTASSGSGIADRMVGGMAQITLQKEDDGNVVISDYGITALVCHLKSGQDGVTVKTLSSYNEELASENEIRRQDPSFSHAYCIDLCDKVWGDLWR